MNRRLGWLDIGRDDYKLTLTNKSNGPVEVEGIDVVVTQRSAPVSASFFALTGGNDDNPVDVLKLDLDQRHPQFIAQSSASQPFFQGKSVRIDSLGSGRNAASFSVISTAKNFYVSYYLNVRYVDPFGRERTLRIDSNLQITGGLRAVQYADYWAASPSGGWVLCTPREKAQIDTGALVICGS